MVTTLAAAVAAHTAGAISANADNWGSTACSGNPQNCVSLANNSSHAVKSKDTFGGTDNNSIPTMSTNLNWALKNAYNDITDLAAYRDQSDPYPDVVVADWDYGYNNGITGWANCPSNNTGTGGNRSGGTGWCRGQDVRFNAYYFWHDSGVYDNAAQQRNVACHELGHTVGLRHRNETYTCMHTYAGAGAAAVITTHDINHINARY